MNIWLLLLTLLNVILLAVLALSIFLKIKEKKEDQRLTKGLQLLQNKISILQDLSDKTDEQVRKLVHLIDQKASDLRIQIQDADQKTEQIDRALSKALDISKVFSEQVPQQEILQRQKTNAYVVAAKMAHQGFSTEQIMSKVDLSPAEIEMIRKVNKEQLQFAEEALPSWVNLNMDSPIAEPMTDQADPELNEFASALGEQNQRMKNIVSENAFDPLKQDMAAQSELQKQFNQSITQEASHHKTMPQSFVENGKKIRPVQFRKINSELGSI